MTTGETEIVAQEINEGLAGFDALAHVLAVDTQAYLEKPLARAGAHA
jgi:hypothetical protein